MGNCLKIVNKCQLAKRGSWIFKCFCIHNEDYMTCGINKNQEIEGFEKITINFLDRRNLFSKFICLITPQ